MASTTPQLRYIWQHPAWPRLTWDAAALAPVLEQARLEQGRLLGLLGAIGLEQANADLVLLNGKLQEQVKPEKAFLSLPNR